MVLKILITFLLVFNAYSSSQNIFEGQTSIEKPFELRDPFRPPNIRVQREKKIVGKISTGVYSNIPILGDVELDKLEVVGVIIGKERRAFVRVKGDDKSTFTIKEGVIIGENDAELKAILPGGLILVEKTTNIYGQEEYLETVIPISK